MSAGALTDVALGGGLRCVAASDDPGELSRLCTLVGDLGHEAVACVEVDDLPETVGSVVPDVALVRVGPHAEPVPALGADLGCPVVVLSDDEGPERVAEAVERAIFTYLRTVDPRRLRAAVEHVLRRGAELHLRERSVTLVRTAVERRLVIEQAKGVLMERYSLDEHHAFALLRDAARHSRRVVADLARTVAQGGALLQDEGAASEE